MCLYDKYMNKYGLSWAAILQQHDTVPSLETSKPF